MKIAYDHTIFLIQKYGGISRYFNEILKNLNNDIDIKICCPFHINEYVQQLPLVEFGEVVILPDLVLLC